VKLTQEWPEKKGSKKRGENLIDKEERKKIKGKKLCIEINTHEKGAKVKASRMHDGKLFAYHRREKSIVLAGWGLGDIFLGPIYTEYLCSGHLLTRLLLLL
jgi:hypothetical protein